MAKISQEIIDKGVEALVDRARKFNEENGARQKVIDVVCDILQESRPDEVRTVLETVHDDIIKSEDGYHTFDELYDVRMLYHAYAVKAWMDMGYYVTKSWRHPDGEECFGGDWFIVVAYLPSGQVSSHYHGDHWNLFSVPEVYSAPEFDGHTTEDVIERLKESLV